MNISRWMMSLFLLVATAPAAWGDIPIPGQPFRPRPKSPEESPKPQPRETARTVSFEVMVATSGGSGTPQLIIPRDAVKGLLADAGGQPSPDADRLADAAAAPAPTAEGSGQGATNSADDERFALSPAHSIIAGLAMALAVALGGVWMARSRGRASGHGLVLLISASLCLGVGVTAWADLGPPPQKQSPTAAATSTRLETALTGKVQVKFVSGDGAVQLVLPHSDLLKLLEKENAKR